MALTCDMLQLKLMEGHHRSMECYDDLYRVLVGETIMVGFRMSQTENNRYSTATQLIFTMKYAGFFCKKYYL